MTYAFMRTAVLTMGFLGVSGLGARQVRAETISCSSACESYENGPTQQTPAKVRVCCDCRGVITQGLESLSVTSSLSPGHAVVGWRRPDGTVVAKSAPDLCVKGEWVFSSNEKQPKSTMSKAKALTDFDTGKVIPPFKAKAGATERQEDY